MTDTTASQTNTTAAGSDPIAELTSEQREEGARNWSSMSHFLMTVADRTSKGELLLSQGENGMWMHTGFHVDTSVNRLFAKVGDFPFQPIGYWVEGCFLPNAANKVFWARTFTFAQPIAEALSLPFVTSRVKLEDTQNTMSAAMLKQAESVLEDMTRELKQLFALDAEQRKKEMDSVREYNKLLCLKFPPLDAFLKDNIERNPELQNVLASMDPIALLSTEAEWLKAKISDETYKRHLAGLSSARIDLNVAQHTLDLFRKALADNASDSRLTSLLNGAYVTDPLLRETIDGAVLKKLSTREIIEKLIPQLEHRLKDG
jgi:hypothetical protein